MTRRGLLELTAGTLVPRPGRAEARGPVLSPELCRPYVEEFNRSFPEEVVNYIPDAQSWRWMAGNIPLFSCPDPDVERLYYYRWWSYRKHIKDTPAGFLITEFLKPVKHAGEHNALSCAFGLHVAEGRWLRDRRFVDGDIEFWLRGGEDGGIRSNFHQFSQWTGAVLFNRWLVDGRRDFLVSYLDPLIADYEAWERERMTPAGLFWQRDVSDGMEESISGGRRVRNLRPSINSYLYGSAAAIASIAAMAGKPGVAAQYRDKADRLRTLVLDRLWNPAAGFFETVLESGEFAAVRELIGYTPWLFDLTPEAGKYDAAWKQLLDPHGFYAPYGPTTAERRHSRFQVADQGDDCQWNGPSWPFATTLTLTALAKAMNRPSSHLRGDEFFRIFEIYTRSQRLKLPDGRVVPFIDENLNPFTGEWLARVIKMRKPGFYGRGDHYNHSGYADLVITGLAGLRPRAGDIVEVNPLLPANSWDWFCLDALSYHDHSLTIIWDSNGRKFGRGKGLAVFADGVEIARAARLSRLTGRLV